MVTIRPDGGKSYLYIYGMYYTDWSLEIRVRSRTRKTSEIEYYSDSEEEWTLYGAYSHQTLMVNSMDKTGFR